MLLQKQRKSTFTISALVIGTLLAFWTWLLPAYGMGPTEKIEGILEDLPEFGAPEGVQIGLSIGRCALKGISLTGQGVEAISYQGSTFTCEFFSHVDDLLTGTDWCSQWVLPGTADPCLDTVKPKKVIMNNKSFVYCHKPACALWDVWASGGDLATGFRIKRSFSKYGNYSKVQTETSISYFNVHGSDTTLWWKICGFNEYGQTCSAPFRTGAQCSIGGHHPY